MPVYSKDLQAIRDLAVIAGEQELIRKIFVLDDHGIILSYGTWASALLGTPFTDDMAEVGEGSRIVRVPIRIGTSELGYLVIFERNDHPFWLMFVDLDRFKHINDTHGHKIGDHVLEAVARRRQHASREEDLVGWLSVSRITSRTPSFRRRRRGPCSACRSSVVALLSAPDSISMTAD